MIKMKLSRKDSNILWSAVLTKFDGNSEDANKVHDNNDEEEAMKPTTKNDLMDTLTKWATPQPRVSPPGHECHPLVNSVTPWPRVPPPINEYQPLAISTIPWPLVPTPGHE